VYGFVLVTIAIVLVCNSTIEWKVLNVDRYTNFAQKTAILL